MKSVVKSLGGFLVAAVLARAAATPRMPHELTGAANGCFVESVAFRERAGVETLRVLRLALLRMFPGARDLVKL